MPGPGQDIYINLSFPSRMTKVIFEILGQSQTIDDPPQALESGFVAMDVSQVDRSLVTPRVVRFLLAQYTRCIRPEFDLLPPELLSHDGSSLKKLHGVQRFQILMACAIATARESYKSPSWKLFAQICRARADDLITPIITVADADSLAATLLLLLYEMADPNRGIVWELLDLANRTCLQLGWHRPQQTATQGPTSQEYGSVSEETICSPEDKHLHLLHALGNIQGYERTKT